MEEINEISERVHWIYCNYQDAVEFNSVLNAIYQNYWGKVMSTSTIERAGRFWRQTMPQKFIRSGNKTLKDFHTQKEMLEVFAQ